jgi:hypothetical protein
VYFGPKILERGEYKYLIWDDIWKDAIPFEFESKKMENIFVPAPHALAYSKIVSFLGRIAKSPLKAKQDLVDFVDLTNQRQFISDDFYNLMRKNLTRETLYDFRDKTVPYKNILMNSHLQDLAFLFLDPVWCPNDSGETDDKGSTSVYSGFWESEWSYGDELCRDLLEIRFFSGMAIGRRAARTGIYLHNYRMRGFYSGDGLCCLLGENISGKTIGVSLVLYPTGNFSDELDGLAIRPAGAFRPEMGDSALFSNLDKVWASKVKYKKITGSSGKELWDTLQKYPLI